MTDREKWEQAEIIVGLPVAIVIGCALLVGVVLGMPIIYGIMLVQHCWRMLSRERSVGL